MYYPSIDIIIPSYRLQENFLLPILNLEPVPGFSINYFVTVDDPAKSIPAAFTNTAFLHNLNISVNAKQLGPAASRNRGIDAGKGDWILFLDDDIIPSSDLLLHYSKAITSMPDAVGFAGVTHFPQAFNAATRALEIGGWTTHSFSAAHTSELRWSPTSNIMINRAKMGNERFDEQLQTGEDIEFFVRLTQLNDQKLISLPAANVSHGWWDNGKVQTKRLFNYGKGTAALLSKPVIRNYVFRDFTNTAESFFLWLLFLPIAVVSGRAPLYCILLVILLIAEYGTNWMMVWTKGRTVSMRVAWWLTWHKNVYQLGCLIKIFRMGQLYNFANRIETGFNREYPSSFRTNRWKIVKMLMILILSLAAMIAMNA